MRRRFVSVMLLSGDNIDYMKSAEERLLKGIGEIITALTRILRNTGMTPTDFYNFTELLYICADEQTQYMPSDYTPFRSLGALPKYYKAILFAANLVLKMSGDLDWNELNANFTGDSLLMAEGIKFLHYASEVATATGRGLSGVVDRLSEEIADPYKENNKLRMYIWDYFTSVTNATPVMALYRREREWCEFLFDLPAYREDIALIDAHNHNIVDYFAVKLGYCQKGGYNWTKLQSELVAFLDTFPYLTSYPPFEALVLAINQGIADSHVVYAAPPVVVPKVRFGDQELELESSILQDYLAGAIAESAIDDEAKDAAIKRLSRKGIVEEFMWLVKVALADSGNLETIQRLVNNSRGRIRVLHNFIDKEIKGGERVVVSMDIDNGQNNGKGVVYCTLMVLVEFTGEQNEISLFVMPAQAGGAQERSAAISVVKEEEAAAKVQEVPAKVVDYLMLHPLFDFDWENQGGEAFLEELGLFVLSLFEDGYYANAEYRQQVERLLFICLEDSSLKEGLVRLLSDNVDMVKYSPKKDCIEAGKKYPRIIVRQLLSYLAGQTEKKASTYTEGFTQEAKNIIESYGDPDTSTATKLWVVRSEYRLQICVVNGKVIPVVTWHNH